MKKYIILGIIGIIIVAFAISLIFFVMQPPTSAIPPDFQSTTFSTNAKLIAQEISLYNETEIRDYPLTDLSIEEIKSILNMLDSGNLSKLLLNMPVNDIKKIQKQLSNDEFNSILKRLPNETSIIIKNI